MTDEYEKHTGQNHRGTNASSPYPASRLAPEIELVNLAKEISQADAVVNTRVSAKLNVIANQIKQLQAEAKKVLEDACSDQQLHRAQCNFQKIPGQIYHLYQKQQDQTYFSRLSPDDWQGKPPHEFLGSYRLENDMSWTASDKLEQIDSVDDLVKQVLQDKGL